MLRTPQALSLPILPSQAVVGLTILERALTNFITLLFVIFVGDRWIFVDILCSTHLFTFTQNVFRPVRNIALPSYCLQKMNNYWTQAPPPAGTGLLCLVETRLVLPRYLHPGCCALPLGGCPCQHEQGGVGPGLIKRLLALV